MTGVNKPHDIVQNGMSLPGFFRRYSDDLAAEAQFEKWRWPTGPEYPHCASTRVSVVKSRRPQPSRCKDCRRHFSFKTDTPMHDSKLSAQTWLLGLFIVVSNPKGRIATSKGGTDHMENLQLLCGHCNRVKGDRGMPYLRAKLQLAA